MVDAPEQDELVSLEAAVLREPTLEEARARLLEALCADPAHFNDPRRLDTIEWFVENSPRNRICTTPFMRVNAADAGRLTDEIAQHNYRKHWAHTVFGLLACGNEDLDRAVSHLRSSADVRPEYRLSSYGPSLDLVREVCRRGRWDDGLA